MRVKHELGPLSGGSRHKRPSREKREACFSCLRAINRPAPAVAADTGRNMNFRSVGFSSLSIFERATQSLDLMLAEYPAEEKSAHWQRFFTPEKLAPLRDFSGLSAFRSGVLIDDIEETARWFSTASAYAMLKAEVGREFIEKYSEPAVGKPENLRIDGMKINMHELGNLVFLRAIIGGVKAAPRLICEIGGGFGSLAHKLKLRFPDASYVSYDLPEALTLQAYYLSRLHPTASFYLFSDYIAGRPIDPLSYDFTLLPGWIPGRVKPASVDLFINTRSMMEMNPQTIARYFDEIQSCLKVGGAFYNVNRYCKSTVGKPIRFKDYPYDGKWSVSVSRPLILQPHIHELLSLRTFASSGEISTALAGLPADVPLRGLSKKVPLAEKKALAPLYFRPQSKS